MAKKKTSKKGRKIKIHRLLFTFLFAYLAWIYVGQIGLKKDLEAKEKAYERQIMDLKEDIKSLEDEIDNSDSLQFVEKIAREELGMVKPREIIVIDKNK